MTGEKVTYCRNCQATKKGHKTYLCTNKNYMKTYCDKTKKAMWGDCPYCGLGTYRTLSTVV
ncbi:MAG: hypothetical protein COZ18_10065 [Flexibacter sp. CG_4_10_14_3_um_filter_32_15]|nr:MAG: hypothetical protein COZ18_10065 [Flexibacter sp. CG_4_10_14_3_um_filter_32_15]